MFGLQLPQVVPAALVTPAYLLTTKYGLLSVAFRIGGMQQQLRSELVPRSELKGFAKPFCQTSGGAFCRLHGATNG